MRDNDTCPYGVSALGLAAGFTRVIGTKLGKDIKTLWHVSIKVFAK